jgi:hypothetical protein
MVPDPEHQHHNARLVAQQLFGGVKSSLHFSLPSSTWLRPLEAYFQSLSLRVLRRDRHLGEMGNHDDAASSGLESMAFGSVSGASVASQLVPFQECILCRVVLTGPVRRDDCQGVRAPF